MKFGKENVDPTRERINFCLTEKIGRSNLKSDMSFSKNNSYKDRIKML